MPPSASRVWTLFKRVNLVVAALVVAVVLCEPKARRYGDRLQVALPLVAYACAIADGKGSELLLRFAAVFVVSHTAKRTLGDIPLNTRPSGGEHGFPSAHTAAASFGASSLVTDCLPRVPVVQATIVIAAGFVGASRIEAGKHDIWQVLGGAIIGWVGDRLFRREGPGRQRVRGALYRSGVLLRRAVNASLAFLVAVSNRALLTVAAIAVGFGGRSEPRPDDAEA